jgi:hypothetical protein
MAARMARGHSCGANRRRPSSESAVPPPSWERQTICSGLTLRRERAARGHHSGVAEAGWMELGCHPIAIGAPSAIPPPVLWGATATTLLAALFLWGMVAMTGAQCQR